MSFDSARAPGLDRRALAQQFDRRAPTFERHDFLFREVERRMIERLEAMRVDARRVVDLGCGTGRSWPAWQTRFPDAELIGIDLSHKSLSTAQDAHRPNLAQRARALLTRAGRSNAWIQADFGALPLRDGAVDVALSNMALHFAHEPHRVLPEWARVVRTDGLVMFSCLGPDTLRELREVWPEPASVEFVDMHDYGDMLVQAGCTAPVMDAERLTLTYTNARQALRELHAVSGNARCDRRRGLFGKRALQAALNVMDARRDAQGRFSITIELIYGHAWKSQPKQRAERLPDGRIQVAVPFPRRPAS